MKILLIGVLFLVVAQFPSCDFRPGEQASIVGFVDEKYLAPGPFGGTPQTFIVIGATEYQVPPEFYREVQVGDLVKLEDGRWTIVRKAGR